MGRAKIMGHPNHPHGASIALRASHPGLSPCDETPKGEWPCDDGPPNKRTIQQHTPPSVGIDLEVAPGHWPPLTQASFWWARRTRLRAASPARWHWMSHTGKKWSYLQQPRGLSRRPISRRGAGRDLCRNPRHRRRTHRAQARRGFLCGRSPRELQQCSGSAAGWGRLAGCWSRSAVGSRACARARQRGVRVGDCQPRSSVLPAV